MDFCTLSVSLPGYGGVGSWNLLCAYLENIIIQNKKNENNIFRNIFFVEKLFANQNFQIFLRIPIVNYNGDPQENLDIFVGQQFFNQKYVLIFFCIYFPSLHTTSFSSELHRIQEGTWITCQNPRFCTKVRFSPPLAFTSDLHEQVDPVRAFHGRTYSLCAIAHNSANTVIISSSQTKVSGHTDCCHWRGYFQDKYYHNNYRTHYSLR